MSHDDTGAGNFVRHQRDAIIAGEGDYVDELIEERDLDYVPLPVYVYGGPRVFLDRRSYGGLYPGRATGFARHRSAPAPRRSRFHGEEPPFLLTAAQRAMLESSGFSSGEIDRLFTFSGLTSPSQVDRWLLDIVNRREQGLDPIFGAEFPLTASQRSRLLAAGYTDAEINKFFGEMQAASESENEEYVKALLDAASSKAPPLVATTAADIKLGQAAQAIGPQKSDFQKQLDARLGEVRNQPTDSGAGKFVLGAAIVAGLGILWKVSR